MSGAWKTVPSKESSEGAWKTWYSALESSDMSKEEAQSGFFAAWQRFGQGGVADTYSLRSYFKGKGMDFSKWQDGIFDFGGGIFTGLKYGFSYLGFMLFLVIAVLTVLFLRLLWGLVKDPIKTLKTTGEAIKDIKSTKLQISK